MDHSVTEVEGTSSPGRPTCVCDLICWRTVSPLHSVCFFFRREGRGTTRVGGLTAY
uniref:Uncharacterized protein n=1 Tax=Anguilla anguilla TaxID=7936 RepID=A0A0E9TCT6_ANGAN